MWIHTCAWLPWPLRLAKRPPTSAGACSRFTASMLQLQRSTSCNDAPDVGTGVSPRSAYNRLSITFFPPSQPCTAAVIQQMICLCMVWATSGFPASPSSPTQRACAPHACQAGRWVTGRRRAHFKSLMPLQPNASTDPSQSRRNIRRLATVLPAGFSYDWQADEQDAFIYILTVRDRRGTEYTSVCRDGEFIWVGRCPGAVRCQLYRVGWAWHGMAGATDLTQSHIQHAFPSYARLHAVSDPVISMPASASMRLLYFDGPATSFGAKALCFYRYGSGVADFRCGPVARGLEGGDHPATMLLVQARGWIASSEGCLSSLGSRASCNPMSYWCADHFMKGHAMPHLKSLAPHAGRWPAS